MPFVAALAAAAAAASARAGEWAAYKQQFAKQYVSAEEEARAATCWAENAELAKMHAARNPHARFGDGVFSDQCWDDFRAARLMEPRVGGRPTREMQPMAHDAALRVLSAAASVDWREKGALNPVQDQAQCGSCWAFSTVANVESQYFLAGDAGKATNKLVKLSEQELVSCDHFKDDTGADKGCQGGWPDRALSWMLQNGGLTTEKNYPYTSGAGKDGTCDTSKETPKALNIAGFQDLPANEEYVAAYVAKYGPVAIGADATNSWQQYKGGILDSDCGQTSANHGIVIIGYGTDSGKDYWLIRNSWGASWGESGYLRLARGKGGVGCNSVVGHVVTALFSNRSLCLQDCTAKEECCVGDCYTPDSSHKCCKGSGACASPSTCCGDNGGNQCCAKSEYCCGGQCCDPDVGVCSPDGSTCCPKASMCGGECCTGINKCCANKSDPSKSKCQKQITDTCCDDGHSCGNLDACCGSHCCKFMREKCVNGKCEKSADVPEFMTL